MFRRLSPPPPMRRVGFRKTPDAAPVRRQKPGGRRRGGIKTPEQEEIRRGKAGRQPQDPPGSRTLTTTPLHQMTIVRIRFTFFGTPWKRL